MADRTWDLWMGGNICRGIEDWRGVENVDKMLSRRGILSWVSDHWSINGRNIISTSTCSKRMNFNSSLGRDWCKEDDRFDGWCCSNYSEIGGGGQYVEQIVIKATGEWQEESKHTQWQSNSIAIAITIVMMGKKKEMEEKMKRRTRLIYSNWKTHWQLIVPKHPIMQHLQIGDLLKQGP